MKVKWEKGSYNAGQAKTYTVEGTLIEEHEERLYNPTGKKVEIQVTLKTGWKDQLKDKVLAQFTFDDEEKGFSSSMAQAQIKGSGTPQLSTSSISGKALMLNGTGDVWLEAVDQDGGSLLKGKDEVTFSFYTRAYSAGANWPLFAAPDRQSPTVNYEHYLGIIDHVQNMTVERFHNSGVRPAVLTAASTGEWKHIVLVVGRNRTALYLNGKQVQSLDSAYLLSDILGASGGVLQIGKANWNNEYYKGYIDNFMIFDGALSAEEVAAIGTVYSLSGEEQPIIEHMVTLDVNEGAALTETERFIAVRDGQAIGSLLQPTRKGFKFLGWFTAKEGGEPITEDTIVTEDMTIYAQWEKFGSADPEKEQGKLEIKCTGFTYTGSKRPDPQVVSTTNEGAKVTYTYYADAKCKKTIQIPVNAGTYYVIGTVQETEKYAKAISEAVKFIIKPKKVAKATVTGIKTAYYTKKAITQPNLKVKGYEKGTDYTVVYKNNVKVGTATVTIKFKGNYTGAIKKTFQIKKQIPGKNKVYKVGNYQYKVVKPAAKGGTVEFKKPVKKAIASALVPSTVKINGYTFKVTSIGARAFAGCSKLRQITVKTTKLKKVGKDALKGICEKAVIKVPKAKKKAYTKLLKGKGQRKTVKIK